MMLGCRVITKCWFEEVEEVEECWRHCCHRDRLGQQPLNDARVQQPYYHATTLNPRL
jgi:hypothetical protein